MHPGIRRIPAPPRFRRALQAERRRRNRRAARTALLLWNPALRLRAYGAVVVVRESHPKESAAPLRVPRSHALRSMPRLPEIQFLRIVALWLQQMRLRLPGERD